MAGKEVLGGQAPSWRRQREARTRLGLGRSAEGGIGAAVLPADLGIPGSTLHTVEIFNKMPGGHHWSRTLWFTRDFHSLPGAFSPCPQPASLAMPCHPPSPSEKILGAHLHSSCHLSPLHYQLLGIPCFCSLPSCSVAPICLHTSDPPSHCHCLSAASLLPSGSSL